MSLLLDKILKSAFDIENTDWTTSIHFEASSKRLVEKELNDMEKGKDLSYVRGNVQAKKMVDYNFGFPIYEVYYSEKNVSFGRFEREVINELPREKWGVLSF